MDYFVNTEPWMSCTTQVSPTIQSHLRTKIHSTCVCIMHLHTQTYHTSRQWNSLLQSHGHLILLACFVGFSSIQFLIIPFQTRRFFVNLKWITCPYPQNNQADFPSQNPVNLVLLDPGGLGQEHRGQVGLGSYGRNGHQP